MNESKPDVNKVLFMHLVSMLAMSAIQQMGKLVNPGTGKAEINLEAAQATIDMLDMLAARTQGNLDAEETRLLKDTLMSLKMNYVESKDRKPDDGQPTTDGGDQTQLRPEATPGQAPDDGAAKTGGGADDKRQTTDGGPAKTESGKPASGAEDDKTPKYHKKYE